MISKAEAIEIAKFLFYEPTFWEVKSAELRLQPSPTHWYITMDVKSPPFSGPFGNIQFIEIDAVTGKILRSLHEKRRSMAAPLARTPPTSVEAGPIITAALDSPRYGKDLSTWLLEIYDDGQLEQIFRKSDPSNDFGEDISRENSSLPTADVDEIVALANQLKFGELPARTRARSRGEETVSISIRNGKEIRTVEVHGPLLQAREGPAPYIWTFVQLWQRIMRHSLRPETEPLTLEAVSLAAEPPAERQQRLKDEREAACTKRGLMDVVTIKNGFALCPFCAIRFPLYSDMFWDGARHLTCGTWIRLPRCVDGLTTRQDFKGCIVRDGVRS